ncbi:MAG: hypothetical protein IPP69_10355 [Flavobacteriales bacterium]|nr:hypothetical protein [Flavobacteriales bacterium]
MKKILFTALVMLSAIYSRAQSDSVYVDLGINSIRLINLGLGAQNVNPDVWNPYLLTTDIHYNRLGVRAGIGYTSHGKTELPVDANGMSKTESDTTRTDIRIGVNWEIALAPKWTFKVGMDYYSANAENTYISEYVNEQDEVIETNRKKLYKETGFSPFVYVQYHITPRVSLGTELLWRFGSYTSEDGEISSIKPENAEATVTDITRKYEGIKRGIMAPTALFLNFRF